MNRNFVTFFLLLVFFCCFEVHAGPVEADDTPIRELLDELVAAYNRHDTEAAAALFSPTADVASMSRYEGREQIGQFFRNLEGDPIASLNPTAAIRFLRPDVAVIDIDTELSGVRGANGNVLPKMMAKAFFVASKHGDRWMFDALRVRTLTTSPSP
jgi:uncharacterized protein (TIGR02246 family)